MGLSTSAVAMADVTISRDLPPGPLSAGAARSFVDATLAEWGYGHLSEIVRLLTSELVTNALLHAGTNMAIVVRFTDDRIRVEVEDASPAWPTRLSYAEDAATGRGLTIVEEIASAWGVRRIPGGKAVWFEVPLRGAEA